MLTVMSMMITNYMAKLVHDEKKISDQFPELSYLCYMEHQWALLPQGGGAGVLQI